MTVNDLLRLAAVVTLIVVGVLLLLADTPDLRDGLGIVSLGLAAWCVSGVGWRRRGP